MKTVAVDVDGVLRDFVTALHNKITEVHGVIPINTSGSSYYNLSSIFFTLDDNYLNRFYLEAYPKECLYDARPYIGALDFMEWLSKQDVKIIIITAQVNKVVQRYTKKWLEKYNIKYDKLIFTSNKQDIDFDVIIEDSPIIIKKLVNAKRDYIVMNRFYNKGAVGNRVNNYKELKEKISKKILAF